MPKIAPNDPRISTLLFRIPHLSNLLIFKDVLKNSKALVELLTGILKLGNPEILYLGYDCFHTARKDVMSKTSDAAIVRICLPGKEIIRRDPNRTVKLLIDELQKPRKCVSLASEVLSQEKEIVGVAITVESVTHFNRFYEECAPLNRIQSA